jgi:hypothetical protein
MAVVDVRVVRMPVDEQPVDVLVRVRLAFRVAGP